MIDENARYGEALSGVYDLIYPITDANAMVSGFGHIAGNGCQIVEAGAGTGRVALPLARAGFAVTAVDTSVAMLDRLRRNDPLGDVLTVERDVCDESLDLAADCVAILNSTLFMLGDQTDKLAFLRNAARWLDAKGEGGVLAVEAYNPLVVVPSGPTAQQFTVLSDATSILFDQIHSDPLRQELTYLRHLRGDSVVSFVEVSRYCHVGELDLLASCAGFRLESRWSDWSGKVAMSDSPMFIHVYRRSS